jgi:5-methylcytosine-specific restriction endonuclease McrA
VEGVLAQKTLVLNRSWVAIDVTSVKRAVVWLYAGVVRAINPQTYEVHDFHSWADLAVARDEPCIRTVRLAIRVPEVVMLLGYNGIPRKEVVFTRKNLYRRDGYTCQYCGARPGTKELSIDHVIPRHRGGRSTWENCVLACVDCNKRKANRLPREAGLHLLKVPTRPAWTPLLAIKLGHRRQAWERFVSDRYWNVELEED